jgi:uncharacterized metal-binding protein YceD (DUF177 family)
MNESERPWSVPVSVAEIPDGGSHYDIVADPSVREAIVKLAALRTLPRLEASFDLARNGDGGVAVRGDVRADVGQTCVVTLEPMESAVHEQVDLLFAPIENEADEGTKKKRSEPPEPLENGVVDLGAIATEFLLLGLDPYPRKPGATLARPEESNERNSPFAGLADLKKRP